MPYWHDDIGKSFGAMMQEVDAPLVYPLTLGAGKRLWPGGVDRAFALRSTTPYPSGRP